MPHGGLDFGAHEGEDLGTSPWKVIGKSGAPRPLDRWVAGDYPVHSRPRRGTCPTSGSSLPGAVQRQQRAITDMREGAVHPAVAPAGCPWRLAGQGTRGVLLIARYPE